MKTTGNNKNTWISFHKSSMNEYLYLWNDSELRSQIEISTEATAFYLLENAAALWRYTGDENYRNIFKSLPLEKRHALVSAACKYINSSSLPEQAKKITASNALSDDALDQAENIFLLRDGLQGVLDLSKYIVNDILLNDKHMLSNLTDAYCIAAEVDDPLLERSDIVSVASRIMEPFREIIKIDISSDDYWWFYKARKWDEMENKIFSDSKLLAENLGIAPAALTKSSLLSEWQKLFNSLTSTTESATNKLKTIAESLKFTGEDKAAAYGLVVSGITNFINQLSGQTTFALAGVQARGIDKKIYTDLDAEGIKAKVKILKAPKPNPKSPDNATAQWSVLFEQETEVNDCSALVINVTNGKLIGVAEFVSEEHIATLVEGLWKDFESIIDLPESIMLLFICENL